MTVQIKTIDLEPKRQTFGHVARRLGGDKPASRYQEATLDVQATANFHYKPLYEPEFWQYDTRKTAVVMEDWYKPLDPRQFYYATYNIARANMNQAVERNFAFVEERGLIDKLSAESKAAIERGLLPLRHLHWGSNMNMTEMTQRGYGTAVTAPCIFSAGDHLGMAQIVSRIGLEVDRQTGVSLDKAKETWLNDAAWQGARRLIEDTLVERDWFQLYVAQTLGGERCAVRHGLQARRRRLARRRAHDRDADGIHVRLARRGGPLERSRRQDRRRGKRSQQDARLRMGEPLDRSRGRGGQAASPPLLGDKGAAAKAGEAATARARSLGLNV